MYRWRHEPHVLEWWSDPGPEYERIVEKYLPRIRGEEPVRCSIARLAGEPIAYVQEYDVEKDDPARRYLPDLGEAVGIDIFIGESGRVHRGLGSRLIRQYLAEIVFARPHIAACIIDPSERNLAAIRAYEKAGFRHVATFQQEGEPDRTYLMIVTREEFTGNE